MGWTAILNVLFGIAEQVIPAIAQVRKDASQSGELTPEQEAAFDARQKALTGSAWWQPDSPTATPPPAAPPASPS
jgi:hypothetical protein